MEVRLGEVDRRRPADRRVRLGRRRGEVSEAKRKEGIGQEVEADVKWVSRLM